MKMFDTAACSRATAWNVYMQRVQETVKRHHDLFMAGKLGTPVIYDPPSDECVAVIQRALGSATQSVRLEMIADFLRPVVMLIDALDNSKFKGAAAKELRAHFEHVYAELHKMKASATTAQENP